MISSLVKRDIRLNASRGSEGMTGLFFFVLVASLFPFALGTAPETLRMAASGIIWVAAVLAALLSLDAVYHRDFEDGTFDLLLLSTASPGMIAFSKMCAHWVLSGGVLVVASVFVSQMLFIPFTALSVLIPSLLLGTIYMSLLGGMGAALTLGTRRPGLLLTLLILPLFIPMLVLGVMAMEAALTGLSPKPYLLLQTALVVGLLPIAPSIASAFLKMHLRSS